MINISKIYEEKKLKINILQINWKDFHIINK